MKGLYAMFWNSRDFTVNMFELLLLFVPALATVQKEMCNYMDFCSDQIQLFLFCAPIESKGPSFF